MNPTPRKPGAARRVGARLLDAIILGLPASITLAVAGLPAPTLGLGGTEAWLHGAVTSLVWFAYHAGLEAWFGTTPGKRILGLKVSGAAGGRAGLGAAALRNLWLFLGLVPVIGGAVLLIAVIAIIVTIARNDDHRGLHDRLADSAVTL